VENQVTALSQRPSMLSPCGLASKVNISSLRASKANAGFYCFLRSDGGERSVDRLTRVE
jgi:hypothetical protein